MIRPPEKCSARRSNGQPCRRFPNRGSAVCRSHGAASPQAQRKAAERVLDEKVRDTLARLGVGQVDNPLVALARLAAEVLAWKDATAALVNRLGDQIRYEDAKGGEQLRAEVVVWERALDRAATVLGAMARLKLDERLVAVEEAQATMIVRALDAGLAVAGITGPVAAEARRAVARELRVLPGGGGPDGAPA